MMKVAAGELALALLVIEHRDLRYHLHHGQNMHWQRHNFHRRTRLHQRSSQIQSLQKTLD